MLRSYARHDHLWPWVGLSPLRTLDDDFRRFFNIMWTPFSSSYCDTNGVLNLSPSYRVKQTTTETVIEVEVPGVKKEAVAVETQGNRLKIIAAKYSPDNRSCLCSKHTKNREQKYKAGNNQSKADPDAPPLPSLVYKLRLRLSSRADLEKVVANYRGDGVLRVSIPTKEKEEIRRVTVNLMD